METDFNYGLQRLTELLTWPRIRVRQPCFNRSSGIIHTGRLTQMCVRNELVVGQRCLLGCYATKQDVDLTAGTEGRSFGMIDGTEVGLQQDLTGETNLHSVRILRTVPSRVRLDKPQNMTWDTMRNQPVSCRVSHTPHLAFIFFFLLKINFFLYRSLYAGIQSRSCFPILTASTFCLYVQTKPWIQSQQWTEFWEH